VREERNLQRPLELPIHSSQKAYYEIYECKNHKGSKSIALLHIHNI
jgi:hypothetical protein